MRNCVCYLFSTLVMSLLSSFISFPPHLKAMGGRSRRGRESEEEDEEESEEEEEEEEEEGLPSNTNRCSW